jgi:hypothetical protein
MVAPEIVVGSGSAEIRLRPLVRSHAGASATGTAIGSTPKFLFARAPFAARGLPACEPRNSLDSAEIWSDSQGTGGDREISIHGGVGFPVVGAEAG